MGQKDYGIVFMRFLNLRQTNLIYREKYEEDKS